MLVEKPRRIGDVKRHWSKEQQLEVVKSFLIVGSVRAAARLCKVPEQTAFVWARQPWWKEMVDDLNSQDQLKLSARLKRIVEKTFDVVEDRLENGDYVYDQKTSKMRRKPVNAKDAAKIGIDFDNKRDTIIRGFNSVASEEQLDDKLNKLAAKFAAIVNGKKDTSDAIDVEVKETQDEFQDESVPVGELSDSVYFADGEGHSDGFLQEAGGDGAGPEELQGSDHQP